MKVLVTGGSGFAGWHLVRALRARHEVVGTYLSHPVEVEGVRCWRVDLTEADAVRELVAETRPEAVVHTAAMSKTGDCERDPVGATRANEQATRHVAEALDASRPDAHLIHFSTDLVYPGDRAMSRESDGVAPVMHYGRTKLAAERAVAERAGPWTILRAALMYGPPSPHAGGATGWLADALRRGDRLELFTDEFRTPVHVDDVVAAVEAALAHPRGLGIVNCGGADRISRRDMGLTVASALGVSPERVGSSTQAEVATDAPRAADVSMDTTRLTQILGRPPLTFGAGAARLHAAS